MDSLFSKKKAQIFGQFGEETACLMLRLKGYRILGRNIHTCAGEIDIIARKSTCLCFVEVKSRKTQDEALSSLNPVQKKRYLRAAQSYLSLHTQYANFQLRFDLIAISRTHWPLHIQNAWWEET